MARILKHLIVLLLGGTVVYLVVTQVFPFFDNRTPLAIALFATYLVTAYLVIPLAFRLFRLFYQPIHLPLYCTTPDGFASDPVNVALVGSRRQVILAMEAAGWQRADRKTLRSVLQQVIYTVLKRSYPNAPVSSLYLFGRVQDLAFQKEISGTRGHRHHVRFWAADDALANELGKRQAQFWKRLHRRNSRRTNTSFWVGAASKDVGFSLIRHNAQITHLVHPNTRRERLLIVRDLRRAGKLAGSRTIPAYRPVSLRNRAWRARLLSDGHVTICELK
ncbi:MAG TPA: LssY C-terminal domain-containing protein [Candidatus Saccharimonadales bacterium]